MTTRQMIIQEYINQGDYFKMLKFAFKNMARKEQNAKTPINAGTLETLTEDMRYIHENYRLVKKTPPAGRY